MKTSSHGDTELEPAGPGSLADPGLPGPYDPGALDAPGSPPGRTSLGLITLSDRVVEKVTACAAAEVPDAGSSAPACWAAHWRQRIETEALAHARLAVENMALPARLDLTITGRRSARVL